MRFILEPGVSIIEGRGVTSNPIHGHSRHHSLWSGSYDEWAVILLKKKKLVSRDVCANGSAEAAAYLWEDGSEDFDVFGLGGSVVLPVEGHTGLSNEGHQVELCISLS